MPPDPHRGLLVVTHQTSRASYNYICPDLQSVVDMPTNPSHASSVSARIQYVMHDMYQVSEGSKHALSLQ